MGKIAPSFLRKSPENTIHSGSVIAVGTLQVTFSGVSVSMASQPQMKTLFTATALLLLSTFPTNADDLIPLFNGRDLSGWKANADPGAFTVNDGILTAHATHPTNRGHLFTVKEDGKLRTFRNFELVAEVRGEPNSNSGIFFHTNMETRDGKLHLKNGYEIQLNSTEKEKRKTGSLYDVQDLSSSPVDETQWFTVRILVEGKHIQAWVNDIQTVDYVEPENPERSPQRAGRLLRKAGGAIALQAHDDKSTFHFRSIRIRPLP